MYICTHMHIYVYVYIYTYSSGATTPPACSSERWSISCDDCYCKLTIIIVIIIMVNLAGTNLSSSGRWDYYHYCDYLSSTSTNRISSGRWSTSCDDCYCKRCPSFSLYKTFVCWFGACALVNTMLAIQHFLCQSPPPLCSMLQSVLLNRSVLPIRITDGL